MPLDVYRRKRDFRRTSEPAGAEPAARPIACSLRAEARGAAVALRFPARARRGPEELGRPEGPELRSGREAARRARRGSPDGVRDVRGADPGGRVRRGQRRPVGPRRVDPEGGSARGLQEGEASSSTLVGEKLRGGWTLARMGGRSGEGGKNWLLLKERDAAARPPRRGRRAGRAAGERGGRAEHRRGAEGGAARDVLAAARDARGPAAHGARVVHELKYDGYRALVRIEKGKARILSRSGKDWTQAMAGVARAAAELPSTPRGSTARSSSCNPTGDRASRRCRTRCPATMRAALTYVVFDAPFLDGRDLRKLPLVARKQALHALIARARRAGRRPLRRSHRRRRRGVLRAGDPARRRRASCRSGATRRTRAAARRRGGRCAGSSGRSS